MQQIIVPICGRGRFFPSLNFWHDEITNAFGRGKLPKRTSDRRAVIPRSLFLLSPTLIVRFRSFLHAPYINIILP